MNLAQLPTEVIQVGTPVALAILAIRSMYIEQHIKELKENIEKDITEIKNLLFSHIIPGGKKK